MKKALILVAIVVLAGCAGSQTASMDQARAEHDAAVAKLVEAQKAPALDAIRGKVYLGSDARQTPLNLLTLEGRPTPEERKAIDAWYAIRNTADADFKAWMRRYMPWNVPVMDLAKSASTTLMAELYTGELTYGEFNRKRMQLGAETVAAADRRTQEIAAQQQQAAYMASMAQAQATSVALQSYSTFLQNQQLVNAQMQPVRIAPFTCSRMGAMTSCF